MKLRFLALLVLILAGHFSSAATLDPQARSALISKLTGVYLNLAPKDPAKVALTLRLADLHAERARYESLKESEKGCLQCLAGQEDRKKALTYYSEVLGGLQDRSKVKVSLQMGHLHAMLGAEDKAIQIYQDLLKNSDDEGKADAQLAIGEIFFKKRQYEQAKAYFQPLIENPKASSRGLAAYRTAWCNLNLGYQDAATKGLKDILTRQELLSRGSSQNASIDRQFQEEVSRDLATFIARGTANLSDVESLFSLSPDTTALQNVVYFASELERLGQLEIATQTWRFALERQSSPTARLESLIHIAQLQMQQSKRAESLKDYQAALNLWTAVQPCQQADLCNEIKSRLRSYVIEWNKNESKQTSPELLQAYLAYLNVFPIEADAQIWAAKVATEQKNYSIAFERYSTAAKLGGENSEVGLVGAVEVAELSKDRVMLEAAYDQYLALSKKRDRELEIRYQKAHLLYEKADYQAASLALKEVALSPLRGSDNIKKQAADLALDALVLLKEDSKIGSWAKEFSLKFPQYSQEFKSIGRKSILNQIAKLDLTQASANELTKAWSLIGLYDLSDSTAQDRLAYYKNRLILAEKLNRFPEAREASDQMLRIAEISAQDREYALARKAWLAELVLDFDGALQATEKLNTEDQREQKLLKMAMYAELASKDPRPYLAQYLAVSKDSERSASMAADLVLNSKDSQKEFEKNYQIIAKNPEMLAAVYLELYAKTRKQDLLKKANAKPELLKTQAGRLLTRWSLLEQYKLLEAEIRGQSIDASNQKKMAASLKARVKVMDRIEKLAEQAMTAGDWSAQLLSLQLLGKESDRFYQELMTLPLPSGLSPEEEQEYLQALSQQAAPYQVKSKDIATKVSEFWGQKSAMELLHKDMGASHQPVRSLLVSELELLAEHAPDSLKSELNSWMTVKTESEREPAVQKPTLAFLEEARRRVRDNPLDRNSLENLLTVEKNMGHRKMVSYLEGRIQSLAPAQEAKEIQ